HGDWLALFGKEVFKLRAIFSSYEAADNVSWYYFVDRSPLLRLSLHFGAVLPLGLIGLWLDRRHAARHRILWYFLVAGVCGLVCFTIVARYRLPLVAVLLVYAGVTVDWAARQIAGGRWRAALAAGVAAIGIAVASASLLGTIARRQRYRADEFMLAGQVYYRHGQAEPGRATDPGPGEVAQTTGVRGTVPEGLAGRWLVVGQILLPGLGQPFARLWEIRPGPQHLEVVLRLAELPDALYARLEAAGAANRPWTPDDRDLHELAEKWDELPPNTA